MTMFNKMSSFFCLVILLISNISFAQDNKFIFAAKFDDVPTLAAFIKQGNDPNVGDAVRGETALMWAIREEAFRAIDFLSNNPKVDINARAKNGDSALMIASYLGKMDIAQSLIASKAKVNQDGWTALHYASVTGHVEIVELLLKNGAKVNALSPNATTPLMMATRSGKLELVKILLQNGANVSLKNTQGMTAYDFATQAEMRSIADYLKALEK